MKKTVGIFLIAAAGAAAGFGVMRWAFPDPTNTQAQMFPVAESGVRVHHTAYGAGSAPGMEAPDFVKASALATPAVVHIKSSYPSEGTEDPFGGLFGGAPNGGFHPQSTGSGVIISADGYIATNNHVVRRAEKVEVTLEDKRTYSAEIVGKDPTTDLALLKITANDLPHLTFGNSDAIQVGEWVLAVGNPFNLTSTVTAGIVSAKGRSLNLLDEAFAIESFIQTDAAVNPGNSGGALINTQGQLVGINTAIASESGTFAGYSFAVPANIVRKVMQDLMEFGEVQRGIIGVQIRNINAELAQQRNLPTMSGAFVTGTIPGGAAESAGIKAGDIIERVNTTPVNSASALQEAIGTYRPGDKVQLRVRRGDEVLSLDVTLRDREGRTTLGQRIRDDIGMAKPGSASVYGANLAAASETEIEALGIDRGVKVVDVGSGKLQEVGIPKGFIITRVNKHYVESPEAVARQLQSEDGSVLVEGVAPDGTAKYFAFDN